MVLQLLFINCHKNTDSLACDALLYAQANLLHNTLPISVLNDFISVCVTVAVFLKENNFGWLFLGHIAQSECECLREVCVIMVMILMVMLIRAVKNRQAACHRSQRSCGAADTDRQRGVSL